MTMNTSLNPNSATEGSLQCLQRATSLNDTEASPSCEFVEKLDQVELLEGTESTCTASISDKGTSLAMS